MGQYDGWKCTHTAAIVSQTDTTATIKVTCYWTNVGWMYEINYVSAWVYCNGVEQKVKTESWVYATDSTSQSVAMGSYTFTVNKTKAAQNISCYAKITSESSYASGTRSSTAGNVSVAAKKSYAVAYNANGGSSAPANQTKWHGETLTLSSAKPSRSGYAFQGWATSASGSVVYASGASYAVNAAVTLYAVWKANTYTVIYNANGGSSAPANQTKVHGQTLTLSSVRPTRTDYNFKGWATAANSTTVAYTPGAAYTANAGATLYAVWELAYTKPRVTNILIQRGDLDSSLDFTANDNGKDVRVAFDIECDFTNSTTNVLCKLSSVSGWNDANEPYIYEASISQNGLTSETAIFKDVSKENSYTFKIEVEDTGGKTIIIRTLPAASFFIDFKPPTDETKGGVAINKSAELDGVFDIGFETLLRGGFRHMVLEPNTDLNDVKTPNTYIGANVSNYAYGNCPLASGTFTLTVEGAGEEGQLKQILTRCSKTEPVRYIRFFYQSTWGEWIHDSIAVEYDLTTGSDLNNYKQSGIWYFNSSHTPVNLPTGCVNGWLVVLRADSGAIKQIWLRYGTLNTNDFSTYVRTSNGTTWSAWRRFAENPVVLFEGSEAGNVTLSESVENFDHIEIIYTDNNGKNGGVAKVYSPHGKLVSASLIEASSATVTLIRSTFYAVASTIVVPNIPSAGYIKISDATITRSSGINYIRIVKVLGYRA